MKREKNWKYIYTMLNKAKKEYNEGKSVRFAKSLFIYRIYLESIRFDASK